MNKVFKGFLPSILIVILLFGCAGCDSKNDVFRDNLIDSKVSDIEGNVCSTFVRKNDWIYYSNVQDGGKLYRISYNGGNRLKLNAVKSSIINVIDDWVYYIDKSNDEKLYRIKNDGSQNQKISDESALYAEIDDKYIYYIRRPGKNEYYNIYRMNLDGLEQIKINNEESRYLNVKDGLVFYSNVGDGGKLYIMKSDGSSKEKLYEHCVSNICVINGWIYFIDTSPLDTSGIYKMKIDGSNLKRQVEGSIRGMAVDKDFIYYSSSNDGTWKIDINGNKKTQIYDFGLGIEKNSIGGNWIYYVADPRNNYIDRVKNDGGSKVAEPVNY